MAPSTVPTEWMLSLRSARRPNISLDFRHNYIIAAANSRSCYASTLLSVIGRFANLVRPTLLVNIVREPIRCGATSAFRVPCRRRRRSLLIWCADVAEFHRARFFPVPGRAFSIDHRRENPPRHPLSGRWPTTWGHRGFYLAHAALKSARHEGALMSEKTNPCRYTSRHSRQLSTTVAMAIWLTHHHPASSVLSVPVASYTHGTPSHPTVPDKRERKRCALLSMKLREDELAPSSPRVKRARHCRRRILPCKATPSA